MQKQGFFGYLFSEFLFGAGFGAVLGIISFLLLFSFINTLTLSKTLIIFVSIYSLIGLVLGEKIIDAITGSIYVICGFIIALIVRDGVVIISSTIDKLPTKYLYLVLSGFLFAFGLTIMIY